MISTVVKQYDKTNTYVLSYNVTLEDGKFLGVPLDEGNRHYQAVLAWVADGNEIGEPE